MQPQAGHIRRTPAACGDCAHRADRLHFGDEARLEDDFADTAPYRDRILRQFVGDVRRQLHDDDVAGRPIVDHRPQRRIAAVAAVPVRFSIELDGVEELRHACRGQQRVDRELTVRDDPRQSGPDVGYRHENRGRRATSNRVDIDVRCNRVTQRIDAQRVDVVRRQADGHEPLADRRSQRALDRPPHPADDLRNRGVGDAGPECAQCVPRVCRRALGECARDNGCVDRTGTGS